MAKDVQKAPFTRLGHQDYILHKKTRKYDGFFKVDEYQISHKMFSGDYTSTMTREIFERGNAVVVIPYDPTLDIIVLNEQFRPGALKDDNSPWLVEFVAGMFGASERPEDVAIREAKEEANLTLDENKMQKIMEYFSSPGGTSEKIYLYVACIDSRNAAGVYGLEEEHEDIKIHALPRPLAEEMLADGKITNAATIIGLQWLAQNYLKLQSQWT